MVLLTQFENLNPEEVQRKAGHFFFFGLFHNRSDLFNVGSKAVQLIVRTGQYYQVMAPDYLTATALDAAAAWIHDLVYTDSNDKDAIRTQQVVEYVFSEDFDRDTPEVRKQ